MTDYPAAPPPGAGYNAPVAAPQNTFGTVALITGILGFFCLGLVGSVLAIIFGKMGMNKASAGLATNAGMAKAGFWLGIVGIVVNVVVGVIWIIVVVANN